MPRDRQQPASVCPYLHSVGPRPAGPLHRPSHRHRCTACVPEYLVAPRTQAAFCLSTRYPDCPYYEVGQRQLTQQAIDEAVDVPS
jgi:hypothetical protein